MHRRRAQTRERQVREAVRERRGEPLELRALVGIECTQLPVQRTRHFGRGNLLECCAQPRETGADRPHRQLGTQPREALVYGGAHGCEAHELREAAPLRQLDEIVHADAADAGAARRVGVDIGRHAEVNQQRRTPSAHLEVRERRRIYIPARDPEPDDEA